MGTTDAIKKGILDRVLDDARMAFPEFNKFSRRIVNKIPEDCHSFKTLCESIALCTAIPNATRFVPKESFLSSTVSMMHGYNFYAISGRTLSSVSKANARSGWGLLDDKKSVYFILPRENSVDKDSNMSILSACRISDAVVLSGVSMAGNTFGRSLNVVIKDVEEVDSESVYGVIVKLLGCRVEEPKMIKITKKRRESWDCGIICDPEE